MKWLRMIGVLKKPNKLLVLLLALLSVFGSVFAAVVYRATEYKAAAIALAVFCGLGALYCLVWFSLWAVRFYLRKLRPFLKSCRFTKIMYNYGFRTLLFSFLSLSLHVAFAIVNGVNAVKFRSVWFTSLAVYYGALIAFRVGVALGGKRAYDKYRLGDKDGYLYDSLRIYFGGGIALFILQGAMAGAVVQMVTTSRPMESGFGYPIVTALYTFWRMGLAVYNIFRAKKYNNYVIQALRNLNFANACISMVSLTVLLIAVFGGGGMTTLKSVVGFGACAVTIAVALKMTVKGGRELKEFKRRRAASLL